MDAKSQLPSSLVSEILDELFESFKLLIPYDRIGYAAVEPVQGRVVAAWSRSVNQNPLLLKPGFSASLAGSGLLEIATTGQPRVLNDLQDHLKQHPHSHSTALIVAEGIRSNLACPVQVHGETVGFLFFSSCQVGTYRNIDQEGLLGIAKMLSATMTSEIDSRVSAERNRRLRDQYLRDPLTGLLNRRALDDCFAAVRSAGSGLCAVIQVHVDHLGAIKDSQGQATAEKALRAVAELLKSKVRQSDPVAAIDGSEFILLMPGVGGQARPMGIAEQIVHEGRGIGSGLTLSVGMITFQAEALDPEALLLLESVKKAMSRARLAGGDQLQSGSWPRKSPNEHLEAN